ncbi:hypothetical protein FACHB389_36305 [Nostoc calcicola FACHB-389]|nr:hypothetical protein FACHB389_36305 [Nostoc calcicola FACHB-389]
MSVHYKIGYFFNWKSLGKVLVWLLTLEVNAKKIKAVFGFLSDRLVSKTIAMNLEANGKKLKVTASSQQELLS